MSGRGYERKRDFLSLVRGKLSKAGSSSLAPLPAKVLYSSVLINLITPG